MGRGRGQIQKAIMIALAKFPNVSAKRLTAIVYKVNLAQPTKSQLSAVYKALRALAREGAIKRSPVATIDGDQGWILVVEPAKLKPPLRAVRC